MINQHRKLIFDKFYEWVSSHIDSLPCEVSDVTAEIWNLEEECEVWKNGYFKLKSKMEKLNESKICHNSNIEYHQ